MTKTERAKRRRERVLFIHQQMLKHLREAYESNDHNKIDEAYASLRDYKIGVYAMCKGGEYSYFHNHFNDAFQQFMDENKEYFK